MRRLLLFVIVLVVASAGFYVAWPAWTGHRIRNAIEANDAAALARQIDFEQVRNRARPLIVEQMQRSLDEVRKRAGPFGAAIAGQLQSNLGDKLANVAIDAALTPENVLRVARQGKDFAAILKDIAREETEKGGAPAPSDAPATQPSPGPSDGPPPQRHRLTHENIKTYRITGPLNLEVGVAHDPAATTPDVLIELAFAGGDWRVVGILPQL